MKTKVAVVGASGLVGQELFKVIEASELKNSCEFLPFSRSKREGFLSLSEDENVLWESKYIFNVASSSAAKQIESKMKPGQIMIDNSSAFRMSEGVPLLVPELNSHLLKSSELKVLANPNCTTILLCVALNAFKKHSFKRVFVSTYQAASGAGKEGLEELQDQISRQASQIEAGKDYLFGFPLFNNVISHNSDVALEGEYAGYNGEESKVIEETRKILEKNDLFVGVTCMRVPVERAHTESVSVELSEDIPLETIRGLFEQTDGVKVVDDWERGHFPMPIEAQNQTQVLVGRIRKHPHDPKLLQFMLAGDQILKGAAYNAFQIFEKCVEFGHLSL